MDRNIFIILIKRCFDENNQYFSPETHNFLQNSAPIQRLRRPHTTNYWPHWNMYKIYNKQSRFLPPRDNLSNIFMTGISYNKFKFYFKLELLMSIKFRFFATRHWIAPPLFSINFRDSSPYSLRVSFRHMQIDNNHFLSYS